MSRPFSVPIPGFRPDQVGATGRAIVATATASAARDAIGLGAADGVTFGGATFNEQVNIISAAGGIHAIATDTHSHAIFESQTGWPHFELRAASQGLNFRAAIVQNATSGTLQFRVGQGDDGVSSSAKSPLRLSTTGNVGVGWIGQWGTADPTAKLEVANRGDTGDPAVKVVTIRGMTGQTAPLTEWQNSSGGMLAAISATGSLLLANTYTGSNNYEMLRTEATGTEYRIGSARGSVGGLNRPIALGSYDGSGTFTPWLSFAANGSPTLGNPLTATLTLPTQGIASSRGFIAASTDFFYWQLRSVMSSPVDGTIRFTNFQGTDFSMLQLGGGTSSFPAVKRNGTAINFRLADDSADAPITAAAGTFSGNILPTANAQYDIGAQPSTFRAIYVNGNSGNGYRFNSGSTAIHASSGNLTLRDIGGNECLSLGNNGKVAIRNWLQFSPPSNNDVARLYSGGDHAIQQRNGVNPQTQELANTYTDANTFELLRTQATGTEYRIGSARGSLGGLNRPLELGHYDGAGTFTAGLRLNRISDTQTLLVVGNTTVTDTKFTVEAPANTNHKTAVFKAAAGSNVNNTEWYSRTGALTTFVNANGGFSANSLTVRMGEGSSSAPLRLGFFGTTQNTLVGAVDAVRTWGGTDIGMRFSVSSGGVLNAALLIDHNANIAATAGSTTIIPPTSDPGIAGALWNNAGTLSISAGP